MQQKFNHKTLLEQHLQQRAKNGYAAHSVLRYFGQQLAERLADNRKQFSTVLELYPQGAPLLQPQHYQQYYTLGGPAQGSTNACGNAEVTLPFAEANFDLVIGNMALPFVGDMRSFLLNCGKALKGDGLLLLSGLGVSSFAELRTACAAAGSTSPHIMPLPDVKALGDVLQSLKFALPVVDRSVLTIHYPNFNSILTDLKTSGFTNLHPERHKGLTSQHFWQQVEQHYQQQFALPDGSLPVTVELLFLSAWRPHHSQQKPLAPGSAKVSLQEFMEQLS